MAAGTLARVPSEVTAGLPAGRPPAPTVDRAAETLHRSHATSLWAMLLAIFDELPSATLSALWGADADHRLSHRYHLGHPQAPAPRGTDPAAARSPARGPPESAVPLDQSPAFDPEATEPAPAFEFGLTLGW